MFATITDSIMDCSGYEDKKVPITAIAGITSMCLDLILPITAIVLGALSMAHVVHFLPSSVTAAFVYGGSSFALFSLAYVFSVIAEQIQDRREVKKWKKQQAHSSQS